MIKSENTSSYFTRTRTSVLIIVLLGFKSPFRSSKEKMGMGIQIYDHSRRVYQSASHQIDLNLISVVVVQAIIKGRRIRFTKTFKTK
jgi:hypothetical protein